MLVRITQKSMLVFAFRPQYVCQISARLKHTHTSYGDFCKVCEMTKKKKKKNTKKFFRKVEGILLKF